MVRVCRFGTGLGTLLLLLGGCAPAPFVFPPSSRLIPVVNSPEAGSAVGRCVSFGEDGPSTSPCPMSVEPLLGRPLRAPSQGRGAYAYGGFVQSSELVSPSAQTPSWRQPQKVTIYEMATYATTERPLRKKLEGPAREEARRICADTANQRVPVVVREFEGCSVTLTGQKQEAESWTLETLARNGTKVGQPSSFWSQSPELELPDEKARCKASRVVRVEVLPLKAICQALLSPSEYGATTSVALP